MHEDLEVLHRSDQRAIRTVDSLTDAEWAGASLLPGWTRAHVVAHLALNAEGFARALDGIQDGAEVPIYDSNEARDAGIAELAAEKPSEIRDRFYAATTHLRHIFGSLTAEQWNGTVNRLPEGPVWPVTQLLTSRVQEVEVHHADLGSTYGPAEWPADFAVPFLERLARNHLLSPATPGLAVHAVDLDRTLTIGAEAPVVTGTAADLAWWLIGRGDGAGLSSPGPLPQLGPWSPPQR